MENEQSEIKQKQEPLIAPPEDVDLEINYTGNSPMSTYTQDVGDLGQEVRRETAAFQIRQEVDDKKQIKMYRELGTFGGKEITIENDLFEVVNVDEDQIDAIKIESKIDAIRKAEAFHSLTEISVSKQTSDPSTSNLNQQQRSAFDINVSDSLLSPVGSRVMKIGSAGNTEHNSPFGSPASSKRNNKRTESVFAEPPKPAFHKENKGPVGMSAVGKTLVFPREDNIYKGKQSIPYDEIQTKVWRNRAAVRKTEHVKEWTVYVLIGVLTGFVAFLMIVLEEALLETQVEVIRYLQRGHCDFATETITDDSGKTMSTLVANCDIDAANQQHTSGAWIFFACFAGLLGLSAGVMTTYYGPGAAGSGVAELIGYLNGINYPNFISIPTLITKSVGVTLAVCGKLCIGKEGPLAHIGANIGLLSAYFPGLNNEFLHNDDKKRNFIAAGASAGVAVAFGAPIGGALFAYEMSRPNTFWKFSMIWKVFVSCAVANFWLSTLNSIKSLDVNLQDSSALKFGAITGKNEVIPTTLLLPAAIILGVGGGCLGSFFINVNTRMADIRKKYLTKKWMKPIETFMFCFATASAFYWVPYLFNSCETVDIEQTIEEQRNDMKYLGWCGQTTQDGRIVQQYNPLASYFWAGEGEIIRNILQKNISTSLSEMASFVAVWYFFTIITYGTNVPAGLFLPGMIIGCGLGDLLFRLQLTVGYDNMNFAQDTSSLEQAMRRKLIVIGCAGFMAGYTRMTYALGVILMETSEDLSIFVPLIFTIIISNQVGFIFTRSLYTRATRTKQMPILLDKIPGPCKKLVAGDIMQPGPIKLLPVESMKNIKKALKTNHRAFPIVNQNNYLIGIIPRNFILTLLEYESFYDITEKDDDVQGSMIGIRQAQEMLLQARIKSKNKYVKKNVEIDQVELSIRSVTNTEFSGEAINQAYPPMPKCNILPWQFFTQSFLSVDKEVTEHTSEVIDKFQKKYLDLRPYMNDNPMTVSVQDSISKCTDVFRKMHLRHLCVIHPIGGKLTGIITRQDLFLWMDL